MRTSPLASVTETKDVLAEFGVSAKKTLGQHFLTDDNVVRRIIELADMKKSDTVLEVGPGIGTLTVSLLARAKHVIAIERDRDLLNVLSKTCEKNGDKLSILHLNALQVTQEQLEAIPGTGLPNLMVANLPYGVAATIVLDFFERFGFLQSATVMVQAEVAERMQASPGTKDFGAYSVKLGMYAKPQGSFSVSASCFYPEPHVDSTVIRLDRCTPSLDGEQAKPEILEAACKMADAAFFQRRKTLRNSCASYFSSRGWAGSIDDVLKAAGIDGSARGETLAQDDFLRLGAALVSNTSANG